MTTKSAIATIKSSVGSSMNIVLNEVHQIGDIISFNNITNMVPSGEDFTRFFFNCVRFCASNDSRIFRIDSILNNGNNKYELMVSPVRA